MKQIVLYVGPVLAFHLLLFHVNTGIATIAYAHVVRLRLLTDAHVVTGRWLQFKD